MSPPGELLNQVRALPKDQKKELILQVIHELSESDIVEDQSTADALWSEIESRLARADTDPAGDLDWRSAVADVRAQLRRDNP
jgi:hypothetical protein